MTSPAEQLKAGWHKTLEEPSVTLPRPNSSDQYDTTTLKLKSSQIPYQTCYQTKTLGMNDQPVWVRHSLFKHESKILSSQAKTTNLLNFHIAFPKSCVACWAGHRSCYFPENVQCSLQANIRTRNKKQKKGRNSAIPVLIGGLASNLLPDGMPKAC